MKTQNKTTKCPLVVERIRKLRHGHIIEYYTAMKMNEFLVIPNINEPHKHNVEKKPDTKEIPII